MSKGKNKKYKQGIGKKEVKLFICGISNYVENAKKSMQNLLELIYECSKIPR